MSAVSSLRVLSSGGALTLADGGYHITDEFDKIESSDVENFNEASETVTEEHAQMACRFFRRSLEGIDFTVGEDSFADINPETKTDQRKIQEAIKKLRETAEDNAASIPEIAEETGWMRTGLRRS